MVQHKSGKGKGKDINVESRFTLWNKNYEFTSSVLADEKKKVVNIEEHEDSFLLNYSTIQLLYPLHM